MPQKFIGWLFLQIFQDCGIQLKYLWDFMCVHCHHSGLCN